MSNLTLVTQDACDRATAYHMSNKIVEHTQGLFVTWLDVNYRAMVSHLDADSGKVISSTPLHQGHDNHCGAAMIATSDGRLQVMAGAHACGGFIHRWSDNPSDPASWSLPESVGRAATYPCLVQAHDDSLLLTHRHVCDQGHWGTNFTRRAPGEWWKWPVRLVKAPAPGYTYPTATMAIGADGVIHLVVEFYKTYPQNVDPARTMAVTHLYSTDHGVSWHHDDGRLINLCPVGIEDCFWLAHDATGNLRPGNVVVLPDHRPAVGVSDMGKQQIGLHVRQQPGEWRRYDLHSLAQEVVANVNVNSQPQLGVDYDGSIVAAMAVSPEKNWANAGNQLLCLWVDPDTGKSNGHLLIDKPDEKRSNWLASIEHGRAGTKDKPLRLIFTDGNKGEGCVNDSHCSVWLANLTRS